MTFWLFMVPWSLSWLGVVLVNEGTTAAPPRIPIITPTWEAIYRVLDRLLRATRGGT